MWTQVYQMVGGQQTLAEGRKDKCTRWEIQDADRKEKWNIRDIHSTFKTTFILQLLSVLNWLPVTLSNWHIQLGFLICWKKMNVKPDNLSYLLFAKFSKQPSINLIRICLSVNQHTKEQSSFSASFINPSERWIYSK